MHVERRRHSTGAVALAGIPLNLFGDGTEQLPISALSPAADAGGFDVLIPTTGSSATIFSTAKATVGDRRSGAHRLLIVAPVYGGDAVPIALTHSR